MSKSLAIYLISAIILIGLVFIGYQMWGGNSPATTGALKSAGFAGGAIAPDVREQFVNRLLSIQNISFNDQDLFQNPIFLKLEDFHVSLNPKPVCRTNPFAPVGLGNCFPGNGNSGPAPAGPDVASSTLILPAATSTKTVPKPTNIKTKVPVLSAPVQP